MSWKKISSVVKYKNRFMTVTEDQVITDYGQELSYGIVHKDPAVVIIPWDGTRFTLVGQYRYSVDQYSWEFPAGHLEHDSVAKAAQVELKEETGLLADTIIMIGIFNVAPGHLTQKCHVFLATGLTQGKQELENSELGMKTKKVTPSELESLISKSEIRDMLTITAMYIYNLHQKNK